MKSKLIKYLGYNAICMSLMLLFLKIGTNVTAQSLSRQVIGVAGGSITPHSNDLQVKWTLGEAIIGKAVVANGQAQATIGFQQPDLSILKPVTNDKLRLNISPNPTPGLVNVTVLDSTTQDLRLTLHNSSGQVLIPTVIMEPWKNEVDLSRFPPGIYFLNVFDQETTFQTYKIIKTK